MSRTRDLPSPIFEDEDEAVLFESPKGRLHGKITSAHPEAAPAMKELAKTEFGRAYQYAVDLLQQDPFSHSGWELNLTQGGYFGASGTYIKIPKDYLEDISRHPERAPFLRSMLLHELMHHFSELEDVSMFAEIVYLSEHGQAWRIEEIQDLYDGRSEEGSSFNETYTLGYEAIAEALEVRPTDVAKTVKGETLARLKDRFRGYADNVIQKTKNPQKAWGT